MYIFLIIMLVSFFYITRNYLIKTTKKNKIEDFIGASYPAELHLVEPIFLKDIPIINFKQKSTTYTVGY